MAKLTTARRNRLPDSSFAGPGRSYPVFDRSHAANAKARATQQVSAGNLSSASAARIRAKANRILGGGYSADGAEAAGGYYGRSNSWKRSPGGYSYNSIKQAGGKTGAGAPYYGGEGGGDKETLYRAPGGYVPHRIKSDDKTSHYMPGVTPPSSANSSAGSAAGGYTRNPAQNAAIHAAEAAKGGGGMGMHPRMHALSLASATHLKNMGHITPQHHARISNKVSSMMGNVPRMQTPMQPQQPDMMGGGGAFGSFAPPMTAGYGDY